MKKAYINLIESMATNSTLDQCDLTHHERSYLVNLFGEQSLATPYTELNCNKRIATKWILDSLLDLSYAFDHIFIASSSLALTADDFVDLWGCVSEIAGGKHIPAYYVTGRGCNSFLSAIASAKRLVNIDESSVCLCIGLEMHAEHTSRFSDYGFFSDGVSIVVVSENLSSIFVEGADSCSLFGFEKIFPYKNFFSLDCDDFVTFNTLNTFPHIKSVKFSEYCGADDFHFRAHSYSLDPVINFEPFCSQSGSHVLHTESPPFHVDTILLKIREI